jgi:Protein of unknown function (DUF4031)
MDTIKIYVDPIHTYAKQIGYKGKHAEQAARVGARHNDQWCHLFADKADCPELHEFAKRLGLQREWFQGDHYDIIPTKRAQAIRKGAIEVDAGQAVAIWRSYRGET